MKNLNMIVANSTKNPHVRRRSALAGLMFVGK